MVVDDEFFTYQIETEILGQVYYMEWNNKDRQFDSLPNNMEQ